MTIVLPKFYFAFAVLVTAGLLLSACGRKPSINDLAVPQSGKPVATAEPAPLDGETKTPEAADQVKPERSFILDVLL